jgi:hypothetical protein
MKRKEIIEKLISEGFTEKTLSRLGDKQLSILAKTVIKESDLMISKKDPQATQKIDAAKKQNKTIETYEEEVEEETNEIEEWVLNLAESKYTQFTSKKDIMNIISEKMETFQPMPSSKPKKGHNDVPEFMTYDSIVSTQPKTAPSKPKIDTPEKPKRRLDPFKPGPGTNPKPKALAEQPKTAPSKPKIDTPEKPKRRLDPFKPGPGTNPKPKALAEKKKK